MLRSAVVSCAAISISLFFSSLTAAQVAEPKLDVPAQATQPAEGAASAPAEAPPAAAVSAANAEQAAAAQRQAGRLQKIQQLQFDRRPSTILRAWSKPPEVPAVVDPAAPAVEGDPVEGQPAAPPPDPFDLDLAAFQRNVTLGDWPAVKVFLAELPEAEGKAAYRQMLQGLQSAQGGVPLGLAPEMAAMLAQMQSMNSQMTQLAEKNAFSFDDVLGMAAAAPGGLQNESLPALGSIVRQALDGGNVLEALLVRLRDEAALPAPALTRRQSARLLVGAGYAIEAGEFLPTLEAAVAESDSEALNLLSRLFVAQHQQERKAEHLDRAWQATQAVLAVPDIKQEEKDEALRRAVDLATQVEEGVGQRWLAESFTASPALGMEIIAAIGAAAAQGQQTQPVDPNFRLKNLRLQTVAVESLIAASAERAEEWRATLELLARNWLIEAEFSYANDRSTSLQPGLRRDPFGNYFYYDEYAQYQGMNQQMQAQPIKTGELLEIKPGPAWLEFVADSLQTKLAAMYAQLYLKVTEEAEAFPYIERLAATHPDRARRLVEELLRVWTDNHDPNANRNRTNYYMFSYGYERRAEGIPLTRSKQVRNLAELAALVGRLKALPLDDFNEELLARAFTTCHSSAEVYRLDDIRAVFGPIEELKPQTLAALAQQMRANLGGLWRQPAVQTENKTNRKQKDIQAEVLRGYSVAREVLADALKQHPDDWSLQLAEACLEFDENGFRRSLAPSSTFTAERGEAFEKFARAAALYSAVAAGLPPEEESAKPFEHWFYASLGACDLENVDEQSPPDPRQTAHIRQAILDLPGESAERHLGMFANSLFTRMSAAKPAVKFRYVRAGFDIVGEHKQAQEARKLYDYYQDLVGELKLEAHIDGGDAVGVEPFGVFVNLRHTREIERESGGFGRYLQNQNNQSFSYNYGRPTENYRDRFQEVVTQALEEHFEVLSVTFQADDVNSRAIAGEYGWRYTPYAYLLVKARGPEVDRIPPLRLDLDFLDTSGYVILPIESAAVPLDASVAAETRPAEKIEIAQILDERQADEGRLLLEIKATARGLVPPLEELLDLQPADFTVQSVEDQGASVSRFDPESEENAILSERIWTVAMSARENAAERPQTFRFAAARREDATSIYQRYVDADLTEVSQEISLVERYGSSPSVWPWLLAGGVAVIAVGLLLVAFRGRRGEAAAVSRFQVPGNVTAFTVLGLLKDIEQHHPWESPERQELNRSIRRIEESYFAAAGAPPPDLLATAAAWVSKAEKNGTA